MDQSFSSAKKLDVLAFFDSSLLNCHFWPFAGVLRKIFGSLTREVWKSSKRYFMFEETIQSRTRRLWKSGDRNLALQVKGFTHNLACRTLRLHARCCAALRGLPMKIRAPA